jgi:lipoprotein NlpI
MSLTMSLMIYLSVIIPGVQQGHVVERLKSIAATADAGRHDEAIQQAKTLLEEHPNQAEVHYLLGRSYFCLGKFGESVRAFDAYVERRPDLRARQWERGIALYYAGQYEEGARQFEMYQTYHSGDVENAVWHFLCRAALDGPEAAMRKLLPVTGDSRVPMRQIYRLYQGAGSVEEVLRAVEGGNPDEQQRAARLFYARLYIGLHHEAWRRTDEARTWIALADREHKDTMGINRYMWWVAHVHANRSR